MTYYITKNAVTTVLIVLISEISKRSTLIGAILHPCGSSRCSR